MRENMIQQLVGFVVNKHQHTSSFIIITHMYKLYFHHLNYNEPLNMFNLQSVFQENALHSYIEIALFVLYMKLALSAQPHILFHL